MKVTCARRPASAATRTMTARPGPARGTTTRTGAVRSAVVPDDPPEALLYGVVRFEGGRRSARNVVLAFENANAADEFASRSGFDDYLVVPLSFLTPLAVH